ncbi:uncharacterized protein B0H18DRAFT_1031190 [Fomitopsis serialis]|uniref:uncharacterized protein n=1 Tax=Fomitopsis serialis TaxID=139415 RepID=UPI0020086778|nr:uncharacterized protein B0H18DRAFT_1031190 [Neoantrodia serialis]KAH9918512.1 hypothetical protein B0H18DRAFT_1031190 [Neoantrodia serialis]
MAVTMLIQYRADKARLFNIYQEDAERYLAGFLGDDLRTLGLPMPHECVFKSWRTGFVLCNWDAADGSSLHRQLIAAFQDIRRSTRSFPDLFIGRIELHDGGSRTVASAPFAYKRQKKASAHTRDVPAPGPGKAPTAPKSTLLARHASSPLARPMAPSHQCRFRAYSLNRFHGEADSSTDERSAAPKETPSSTGLRPGTAAFSAPASGVGFAPEGPSQESPRRGLFPPPSASYAPSPSRASHGSSASSMFSARSSATSMSSISTTASDVGTLMREVWDVPALVQRLEQGNARPGEVPLRARERPWTSEGRGMLCAHPRV